MKAVRLHRRGGPEQLIYEDAPKPTPGPGDALVHGAAGGVGTYAVQLAHGRGAHVIGTSRAVNTSFLRDLGCDEVIDYTTVRFEDRVRDADIVLDTVGGDTLERSWRVLRKGGVLVTIADSAPAEKAAQYGVRGVGFIVEPSRAQLIEIARP